MDHPIALEIAATAARLIVEEGQDWGAAKRRAVRELGLPARTPLPGNEVVEDAVREHIALFCADTQPFELQTLRALALQWMQRLDAFHPYLCGAVWYGTATRLSDIQLALFCDDPKAAEIALINQGVDYQVGQVAGLHGKGVDVLGLDVRCDALGGFVGVHLMIYDHDDLRGALRPDARGRAPRGDAQAVRRLMQAGEAATNETARLR